MTSFPGGTAVSRVRVYDWPTVDGKRGGSPHLHTTSTEGYVVLAGTGTLETLSGEGYGEHPLRPGTMLWFSPGTVHRLVNSSGNLEILVVMSNAGLPEAGDAVLTFPTAVLADPAAYAKAASLAETKPAKLAAAAKRRRDLAIEGYLPLRDQVRSEGPNALVPLYQAAASLVRDKTQTWRGLWRDRPLTQALATGEHLGDLAAGEAPHLSRSVVCTASGFDGRWGMCGQLSGWELST